MEHPDQTPEPRPSSLRHDAEAKLPAAAFLRYETRADGWSAGRQAGFLGHLADHGIVADAARTVGMSLGGGYALRRQARGYAFNLGWEAALIIARRVVADNLMTAAVKGEQSRWVREDGVTTYTRQNTKLSLALLDRVNPATTLAEVMAVATRFDWFLQLIGDGVSAENLWELFFDDALSHDEPEARARVRAALLLCEDLADFDDDGAPGDDGNDDRPDEAGPIEYKSMSGPVRCGERTTAKSGIASADPASPFPQKNRRSFPRRFGSSGRHARWKMIRLETNAHANNGLMAVKVGFDVEIILADVDILVVRITIFGLDETAWSEQVELLFNACTNAVTVCSDAVIVDCARTIVETAFELGVGITALRVDHRRRCNGKTETCADIQIAVGVKAEAVTGGDQVLARTFNIGIGKFTFDTGNHAAELKVITGIDAVHQVALAFADIIVADDGFDVRAGERRCFLGKSRGDGGGGEERRAQEIFTHIV